MALPNFDLHDHYLWVAAFLALAAAFAAWRYLAEAERLTTLLNQAAPEILSNPANSFYGNRRGAWILEGLVLFDAGIQQCPDDVELRRQLRQARYAAIGFLLAFAGAILCLGMSHPGG